ncbi:hypothetical protein B0T25DRAFT_57343 [Lasiosphaeria hispida]|uniref:Uncharacterized protein n=1 Tax=Lasiosphaeria hispida TaxID=260671 RepID=A0AAJ0HW67_9PEZI|nr:hypothetical protein B0T25DRAFT_57343 [Lasiosphaeria hispida]
MHSFCCFHLVSSLCIYQCTQAYLQCSFFACICARLSIFSLVSFGSMELTSHGCSSAYSPSLFPSSPLGFSRRQMNQNQTHPTILVLDDKHSNMTHQSVLDIINIPLPMFATDQQRTEAINRFYHVVGHFEAAEPPRSRRNKNNNIYNRPALVRLTYEFARTAESQDRLLSAFFRWLGLGMADGDGDINLDNSVRSLLFAFAEDLINNFFIPRK